MNIFKFLVLSLFLNTNGYANSGGMIGGGGDAFKTLMFDARKEAEQIVSSYDNVSMVGRVKPVVLAWIEQNRIRLVADIKNSEHSFKNSGQSTCAFTAYQPFVVINFSLPACKQIRTLKDATRMLVHESSHHLGIKTEDSAEEIAWTILNAKRGSNNNNDIPGSAIPAPRRLTCTQNLLAGEDQHPVTISFVFNDPTSSQNVIYYDVRSTDIFDGHETVSQNIYHVISGYPKMDQRRDAIQIFASYDGKVSGAQIPAQYSMAKFDITGFGSEQPQLKAQLFYARSTEGVDTYIPAGQNFICRHP